MEFTNIRSGTDCNCLDNAIEDYESTYCRRINTATPKDNDFRCAWDRNPELNKNETNCKKVCGGRGVSTYILSDTNSLEVIEKIQKHFPQSKNHIAIFKYIYGAGKIKPTEHDPDHFNLFKSDTFALANLNILEVRKISV